MSTGKIIFFVILLSTFVFTLSNQHRRWLIFNGWAASELSNELLNQQIRKTPDWAVDLVIVANAKERAVSFNAHDSEFLYLYSPNKAPTLMNHSWQHLIGAWYVGKIDTYR